MERVIAVEDNLTPVRDFLAAQGCQIIAVERVKDTRVDAVVISGADQNLMGMEDIDTKAPVIDARGLSPQDVWIEIQQRTLM
ncbi:MAG TPA: YkuS family protein [Syntrophomonadaceae bacterium]|nr:YkuS family protein [Syntrophomonadaceae bacterium]HQE24378.1 YkuS family protein [Syntrophomonadaceae bacterium]